MKKPAQLLFTDSDYQIVKQKIIKSGDTVQGFMTKRALEILSRNDFKRADEIGERPSLQFRLDSTLHSLLKDKAAELNRDMSDLFKDVILGDQ